MFRCPWDPDYFTLPPTMNATDSFQGDKHVDPASNPFAARWFKHGRAFKHMDVDAVVEDYAEDCVILVRQMPSRFPGTIWVCDGCCDDSM